MDVGDGFSKMEMRALRGTEGITENEVVRHPRRQSVYGPSSAGSYGFLIKALAEGLEIATTKSWLTEDEAKREFRSHVQVVQEDEVHADEVAALEGTVAKLEEELLRAKAKVEGRKVT